MESSSKSKTWAPLAPTSHAASIGWKTQEKEDDSSSPFTTSSGTTGKNKKKRKKSGKKKPHSETSTPEVLTTSDWMVGSTLTNDLGVNSSKNLSTSSRSSNNSMTNLLTSKKESEEVMGETAPASSSCFSLEQQLDDGIALDWKEDSNELKKIAILRFQQQRKRHSCVCIKGEANISIVQGSIIILGYRLEANHDDKERQIYINSPSWRSLVTIEKEDDSFNINDTITTTTTTTATSSCDTSADSISRSTESDKETDETVVRISSVVQATNKEDTLNKATFEVCVPGRTSSSENNIRPTMIPDTWKYAVNNIISDLSSTPLVDNHSHVTTIATKQSANCINENNNQNMDGYTLAPENNNNVYASDTTDSKTNYRIINNNKKGGRILVCGSKGVGKSTCVRYTINRLLSSTLKTQTTTNASLPSQKNPKLVGVALLDCDVGQPELTPPGMVSLSIFSNADAQHSAQGLINPPHIHMGQMIHARNGNHEAWMSSPNVQQQKRSSLSSSVKDKYFFGHISSKSDPMLYIQLVSKLIFSYQELIHDEYGGNEHVLPLVVNTDGWIKGMGYQILSTLLCDVIQPDHTIQLITKADVGVDSSSSRQFDLQTMLASSQTTKNTALQIVHAFNNESPINMIHKSYSTGNLIPSSSPSNEISIQKQRFGEHGAQNDLKQTMTAIKAIIANPTSPSLLNPLSVSPMALRSLRFCSYFLMSGTGDNASADPIDFGMTGIVDPHCHIAQDLAAAKPYVVPFDTFTSYRSTIGYVGDAAANSNNTFTADDTILDALNGSIVGLCHTPEDNQESTNKNQSESKKRKPNDNKIDDSNSLANQHLCIPCMGLGIIRSIDRTKKCFYILTPIPAHELELVNVIIQGSVQLPIECYYRGVHTNDGSFAYHSCDGLSVGIGADYMKSKSNYLLRKSTSM